ncbi:MAG TPA: serine/threonine-protein kinase [Polyangiaceae bacterium]
MIAGRYRLDVPLGRGGMGEVWRAEHRLLARQAAIKLIRREVVEKSGLALTELRERFQLEAQTLAMLRSRHTIELFDYGVTDDGTFFFVMELLEGIDIETLGMKFGPQPAARVISFLIQACKSLAEAHEAGMVHRDIKPANLFACRIADEVDVIKVLDFGLVHAAGRAAKIEKAAESSASIDPRLTQAGRYLGTPGFMAPEQGMATGEVDGRADLYALACTAVWLLTGRLLFEAQTSDAVILQHIVNPVPPFREWVEGKLPEDLEAVLLDCLAKNPADRPASARVVIERLQKIRVDPANGWSEERARRWWTKAAIAEDASSPPRSRRAPRA